MTAGNDINVGGSACLFAVDTTPYDMLTFCTIDPPNR